MIFNIETLIRPELLKLRLYDGVRKWSEADVILDANESPWPPFGAIGKLCEANRYPQGQHPALCQRLASLYKVDPSQLLISRGSDEGIDLLIRLFCRAGVDTILICPPTFAMYETYAAIQGAGIISVPLDEKSGWQLDIEGILAACTSETKLIFIPTPQAPMGHAMKRDDILALCRALEGKTMIVADEAYVEFTDTPDGLIPDLADYPNLVILRTLSKAYALAGERIGSVIGSRELIQTLGRIISSYPLSQSGIRAALDALSANGLVVSKERCRMIASERAYMAQQLALSPYIKRVFDSVANFILLETTDYKATLERLLQFGIRARNRNSDFPNCIRITIGTPEENDLTLRALDVSPQGNTYDREERTFSVQRNTKETSINVTVNLDKPAFLAIDTKIGFFDHMLAQIAQHGGFGLALQCKGDLQVDQHHSIEDCALALGEAIRCALGDKKGIGRFGFTAPLDEALAEVAIDLSGRPYADFKGEFNAQKAGEMDVEMVPHFFRSLATALGASIHISVKGDNAHHMIEACFKATGRALKQALQREGTLLPSTKGCL